MAVDPAEFERVRALVDVPLRAAFAGSFEPPLEAEPGRWLLWPARQVELVLEETRVWSYGEPGGGTGNLQLQVRYPYSNVERFRPRPSSRPVDLRLVERAVGAAKSVSDDLESRTAMRTPESQAAYAAGYQSVVDLPEGRADDLQRHFARAVEGPGQTPVVAFHASVSNLAAEMRRARPELAWALDKHADKFSRGVMAALEDRALGVRSPVGEGPPIVPPGFKEWRPGAARRGS